jgi:hypothetical protein
LATGDFRFKSDFVVDVAVDEEPVVLEFPSSVPTTAAPGEAMHHSLVFVSWVNDGWKIVEVGPAR